MLFLGLLLCCLGSFLCTEHLQAQTKEEAKKIQNALEPWYVTLPRGWGHVETYLFFTRNRNLSPSLYTSSTHNHVTTSYTLLQAGVAPRMDASLLVQGMYAQRDRQRSFQYGDTSLSLGFQLLKRSDENWRPDVKLNLTEVFPTGRYQHLSPYKLGTDISGSGSYKTMLGVAIQKVFFLTSKHPFYAHWDFSYGYQTPVKVEGFNAYGGGNRGKGKIELEGVVVTLIGLELTLAPRCVLDLDMVYEAGGAGNFSGQPGFLDDSGTLAAVRCVKSKQLSAMPMLKYGLNDHLSFWAGMSFDTYSKNVSSFTSYFISLNWSFPFKP